MQKNRGLHLKCRWLYCCQGSRLTILLIKMGIWDFRQREVPFSHNSGYKDMQKFALRDSAVSKTRYCSQEIPTIEVYEGDRPCLEILM